MDDALVPNKGLLDFITEIEVLILVVMDDALVRLTIQNKTIVQTVLILVVMDDALVLVGITTKEGVTISS